MRIWDAIVGSFMLISGLFISTIIGGLIAIPVTAVLPEAWMKPVWSGPVLVSSMILLLNAAAFYDFYRRRTINSAIFSAGRIHLVPRGLHRILYGKTLEIHESDM